MKIYKLMVPVLLFAMMYGCKEDNGLNKPLYKDGQKPGVVTGVVVTNKNGAAKITYKIPADNDLSYIRAEYEIRPGVKREVKASYSNDSLIVDGFGQVKAYEVKLYAVDKGENMSDAVTVTVNPLSPPFTEAFKDLVLKDDFGGMNVSFKNKNESDIAIVVIMPDKNGELAAIDTYYTKAKLGNFSIRGYEPKPIQVGAYIRDRFGNLSDTLFKEITPILEIRLDRTKFKKVQLPTDRGDGYGWVMENLWNNSTGGTGFHTNPGLGLPLWFTFDLGTKAKLSRFKEYQRGENYYEFNHGNVRKFELWGSNDPPSDGSWTNWVKLGEYESLKPSGLPNGQNSSEDIKYAQAGEEFNFDINNPPVRYIRLKMLQNWSNTDFIHIMELQFWGQPEL
jgi:hypothetical protein